MFGNDRDYIGEERISNKCGVFGWVIDDGLSEDEVAQSIVTKDDRLPRPIDHDLAEIRVA